MEPKYVRTTISLPTELNKKIKKAYNMIINWSAVASAAFRKKLKEIESKKEVKTRDDVITRLKASKQLGDAERGNEGLAAGRECAERQTEAAELERPETFLDDLDEFCSDRCPRSRTKAEAIVASTRPATGCA
jgi:hypothetical protein